MLICLARARNEAKADASRLSFFETSAARDGYGLGVDSETMALTSEQFGEFNSNETEIEGQAAEQRWHR